MEQASSRPSHGDALNRCLFADEFDSTASYICLFYLSQFKNVCLGMLYFAATEAQELPLSTFLRIFCFSVIDFELNFLMLPTWGILQTALQQQVDFFEVLFVFSIFGFM